jgi:hypothetical protein
LFDVQLSRLEVLLLLGGSLQWDFRGKEGVSLGVVKAKAWNIFQEIQKWAKPTVTGEQTALQAEMGPSKQGRQEG